MSSTSNAAALVGKNYLENLHSTKDQEKRTRQQLFNAPQRLIKDQSEIQGVSQIGWQTHPWEGTSLLCDNAVQLSTAKDYVCSDSVLCLGKMYPNPRANDGWNRKIDWFKSTPQHRELDRIDAELMAFESKIAHDSRRCRFLPRFRE